MLRKARPRASARESSSRFAQWRLESRRLRVFSGALPLARLFLSRFRSGGVAGIGLQSPLRIGLDRGDDLSGDDLSRARGFDSVVLSEANNDGRPSVWRGRSVLQIGADLLRALKHESEPDILRERTTVSDPVIANAYHDDATPGRADLDSDRCCPRMLSGIDNRLQHDPIEQNEMRFVPQALHDGFIGDRRGTVNVTVHSRPRCSISSLASSRRLWIVHKSPSVSRSLGYRLFMIRRKSATKASRCFLASA